jgi:tetraacyldisaccharide-1-P 4'-kinase
VKRLPALEEVTNRHVLPIGSLREPMAEFDATLLYLYQNLARARPHHPAGVLAIADEVNDSRSRRFPV